MRPPSVKALVWHQTGFTICPERSFYVSVNYFSEVLRVPKVVLSLLPTPFTAVMIAIAIPAAIRPYSIAVAPESFLMNFKMRDFTVMLQSVLPLNRVQ